MQKNVSKEIGDMVKKVLADYDGGKNIDATDIFNKPDRNEVIDIVDNLFFVMYPGYFKDITYKFYNPKNGIAIMLEDIIYRLNKQVALAIDFKGLMTEEKRKEESFRICSAFVEKIPQIREYLETDLLATYDGDPAASSFEEIIIAYPGLIAITIYRMAHELYLLNVPVIPRLMTEYAHSRTGIDIHPGATIDYPFFIDHGTGTVIGQTSTIGKRVKIYQCVTLGAVSLSNANSLRGVVRHPQVGNDVTIYAGASLLGAIHIGDNVTIGSNVFLLDDVPSNTRVIIAKPDLVKTKK